MQSLIGQTLNNRFELLDIIGTGGMGVVFKALDKRQQEMDEPSPFIALKILKSSFQTDPRFYNLLAQEAKRAQSLNHPHIINVFDFDRSDNLLFMTMELLQGDSLQSLLVNNKLPKSLSSRKIIALQIVTAILYAHRHGVIHSDLKPSNIFIRQSDQADPMSTIFDFGISRALGSSSHSFVGCSPAYATPHTVAGHSAGFYDDAYGLGCVLYSLFQGQHPYDLKSSDQVESASRYLQTITGLNHDIWENLKRLVVFPFYPDAFPVMNDESQYADAQQQVMNWEVELRDSLLPKKRVSLQRQFLLIIFIFSVLYTMISKAWIDQVAQRKVDLIQEQLQQQSWVDVLYSIESYKQEFHRLPSMTEREHEQFLTGLDSALQSFMDVRASTYDPVQAKQVLNRALGLFPDSDMLASALVTYEDAFILSQHVIQQSLLDAIDANSICLEAIEQCKDGMTYFSQLLSDSHIDIFQKIKPSLLQGYVRTFALAIYRKQFSVASRIQSDALLFFPKDTLASLGMLDDISEIIVINPVPEASEFQKTAAQESHIDHFDKVADLNLLLQGAKLEAPSQWSDVFGYVASFQALAPLYDPAWRSFLLSADFHSAFTIQGKDIRNPSNEIMKAHKEAIDVCLPFEEGSRRALSCYDIFPGGQGPLMRSVWLDHPALIANPYRIAVMQYELSWHDLTLFCTTHDCKTSEEKSNKPVFDLSEQLLDSFLHWISSKTGYTYRLLTLEEWQVLADPLALMSDLIVSSSQYRVATCDEMGYTSQGELLAAASVLQGSYDKHGIYNLKDLSPEIVVAGAKYLLVPGRRERLRRCRIAISAYEYPFAAYRLVRVVD